MLWYPHAIMALTLDDVHRKLAESLEPVDKSDAAAVGRAFQQFFGWVASNYKELNKQAKTKVDGSLEAIRFELAKNIEALPDGPEKRRLRRQFAFGEGKHHSAEGFLGALEAPSQIAEYQPIVPAGRALLIEIIQRILDAMFDMTRHSHKGIATFASIGLCYWAVDELLVAVHLAERAYTNQAYSHVRTVSEILDKIELFLEQPRWAELWATGDDKEVWNELKPSAVRKKLGRPKYDELYSLFSELGPHGTFKGLQARSARSAKEGLPRPLLHIWVGGAPFEHQVVMAVTMCVMQALFTYAKCCAVAEEYLNEEEITQSLELAADRVGEFLRQHYVAWAEREKLEGVETLIKFVESRPWRLPQ